MLRVIILFVICKFSVSSVTVSPATVLNGQSAEITCTAGVSNWKAVNLYRKTNPVVNASPDAANLIASLANEGDKKPIFKKLGLGIKTRASLLSKTQGAFTVAFTKTECADSGNYMCSTIDDNFSPSSTQPKSFLVVDNSKRVTLTAGLRCVPPMSATECNQCNADDRNQVVRKVDEEFTVECGKDLPFPDGFDNTFKWFIEKNKNGVNIFEEVTEKITNRNPRRKKNPTTAAPRMVLILGKQCAPTESHKSTLKYTPLMSDNDQLKIKCEVTLRSGSITNTTEEMITVCVQGATAPSTTDSTRGSRSTLPTGTQSKAASLGDGVIAGIVIAVIAFIILVVVLVYFLWYRKRGSGDKYSASEADKHAAGDDYKPDSSETYDNAPNVRRGVDDNHDSPREYKQQVGRMGRSNDGLEMDNDQDNVGRQHTMHYADPIGSAV